MTLTDLAPESNETLLQRVFEDQIAAKPSELAISPEKLREIYEFTFRSMRTAEFKDDIQLFSLADYSIPTILAYDTLA